MYNLVQTKQQQQQQQHSLFSQASWFKLKKHKMLGHGNDMATRRA